MLDLDHLHHQTMGDRALEREVLNLFVGQVDGIIDLLQSAKSGRERREAAHSLAGSASAIGAFDLARMARRIETAEADDADVDALVEVVEKTRAYIVDRLAK
jgi:HPt (histidine-containing phosphotransfer) domain-containing protein